MIRPTLCLLAAAVLTAAPPSAVAGVEFKVATYSVSNNQTTTVDHFYLLTRTTRAQSRSAASQTVTVRAQAGSAVVSWSEPGAMLVLHRAGQGAWVVDPNRRAYARVPLNAETGIAGAVEAAATRQSGLSRFLTGGAMKWESKVSAPRFEVVTLPDEDIGDQHCRHLKLLVRYAEKTRFMKLAGWTTTNHTDSLELWLASSALGLDDVPMALGLGAYRSLSVQVDAAVWKKLRELGSGAFPLRQRIELSSASSAFASDSAIVVERSDVRRVDVTADELDLPAGFSEIGLADLVRAAGVSQP